MGWILVVPAVVLALYAFVGWLLDASEVLDD